MCSFKGKGRSFRIILCETRFRSVSRKALNLHCRLFYSCTDKIASSKPKISNENAIKNAEEVLQGEFNGHPAKLGYLAKEDGSAVLVYKFYIKNAASSHEVYVDAHTGNLALITDMVSHASVCLFVLDAITILKIGIYNTDLLMTASRP